MKKGVLFEKVIVRVRRYSGTLSVGKEHLILGKQEGILKNEAAEILFRISVDIQAHGSDKEGKIELIA